MKVSVVIPVYNSERSIEQVVDECAAVLSATGHSFEFILVDDASRDGSRNVIEAIASRREDTQALAMMRNYGQHSALLAGIRAARGEIVVTIDDDLQHPPAEIRKLLDALTQSFDVVYGTPARAAHSLVRSLLSSVTKLVLARAMGAETASQVSAFRAFRTKLRNSFSKYHSPYVNIDVLLTWGTTRFRAIETEHRPREVGRSNYTWSTLSRHALTMITGFSTLPLRLASITGLAFTLAGFLVLLWVIGSVLVFGRAVPGFAFIASIIVIFSGAQLFALGIIGEYLARVHLRLLDRPPYTLDVTE